MSKKGNGSLPPCAPAMGSTVDRSLVATPLSVPSFLPTDPELWFTRLDLFFRHRHVHDEETRFELALSAMPEGTLGILRDFLLTVDREAAPFTALKAVCLDRLIEDRNHRIRQALSDEELAGRSPSVFLRRLQQLLPAGSADRDEPIIRQLFLSRLPHQVQVTLLPFENRPLPELARIADRVMMLREAATSSAPVFATSHELAARVDQLEERVRQLNLHTNGPPAVAAPHLRQITVTHLRAHRHQNQSGDKLGALLLLIRPGGMSGAPTRLETIMTLNKRGYATTIVVLA
uniref:DUF7041 domain-containing protein n=1 Tax=Trichuris muris TaxID=70415 RepID=A0A5S6Q586_TRIMR